MASPASFLESQSADRLEQRDKQQEQARVTNRDAQAAVLENALNNPDTPAGDRAKLLQAHAALYQPHEAPDLFKRLSGLIHGQKAAPAPVVVAPPQPAPQPATPLHPFATSHPVLDGFKDKLAALDNHLKGFAQPVAKTPQEDVSGIVARNFASPETIKRADVKAATDAKEHLEQTKATNKTNTARAVPYNPGAVQIDDAVKLGEATGATYKDVNTGQEIDLGELKETLPGAKLIPVYQGGSVLGYQIADQKERPVHFNNQVTAQPEFGLTPDAPVLGVVRTGQQTARTGLNANGQLVPVGGSTITPNTPASAPAKQPQLLHRDGTPVSSTAAGQAPAFAPWDKRAGRVSASRRQAPASANSPIVPRALEEQGITPDVNSLPLQIRSQAMKQMPTIVALKSIFGDPQDPGGQPLTNFADLANDGHAQKTLGEAFALLKDETRDISEGSFSGMIKDVSGLTNLQARVNAGVQQKVGTAMTPREQQYFNRALTAMADVIGIRGSTGASAAKFSVDKIENEVPLIGTSSVSNQRAYLDKLLNLMIPLSTSVDTMPGGNNAKTWLHIKRSQLESQVKSLDGASKGPAPRGIPDIMVGGKRLKYKGTGATDDLANWEPAGGK